MKTITEPARSLHVRREVDVVVCGGGPSGVCAAIAAARQGKSVALIEQYGFLGGVSTAAGVNGIGGWQHDIDGTPMIQGIPMEIMLELARLGGTEPEQVEKLFTPLPEGETPDYVTVGSLGVYWVRANPEILKMVLDRMVDTAGIYTLYHSNVTAPLMEGRRITGVIVESKSGREAILAQRVVDCTGDGDIAARAGAPFKMGREDDGLFQPMTQIYTISYGDNIVLNYSTEYHKVDESVLPAAVRGRYRGAIETARKNGDMDLNPNELFCAATGVNSPTDSNRMVNFTRVQGRSSIDAEELTLAEKEGRRQVIEALHFMHKYMPGCEGVELIAMPPQIGVRESRRILGEYELTGDDINRGARFYDGIGRCVYMIDIHNPKGTKDSRLTQLKQPYDLPYRSLVPLEVENLLMAGRCISAEPVALASHRVMSHVMMEGQAAGTAAALSIESGARPRELDTGLLRRKLVESGVNIGPSTAVYEAYLREGALEQPRGS